ncbi:MAG TPA: hypothetical protein VIV15_13905, partial [Anaerolineales bacterium]
QIEKIDPRYPDLAALRSQADQALTKIRTERELESTYNSALQALDGQDWQLAARHLRRVRQLKTGYRESDQLLARAEGELKRKPAREKTPKLPKAIPLPTEKAVPAASSAMYLEWSLPVLFGVFALVSIVGALFNKWLDNNFSDQLPLALRILLSWLPRGILTGLIFSEFLSRAVGKLKLVEKLQILGVAAIGFLIIGTFVGDSILPEGEWYLLWTLYGAAFGFAISGILRARGEIPNRRQFIGIIVAWGLAYGISAVLGVSIGWELNYKGIISEEFLLSSLVPSLLSLGAFLGGWFTLALLKANEGRVVNWKTILAAALSFAVGISILAQFLSSGVSLSSGVTVLLWGLVAGAALAFPSRSLVRYLILGLAVGISMVLANFLFGDTAVKFFIFCGGLVGLVLGLDTKRASGVLIGLILGMVAFGMGFAIALGPYVFPDSLRSALEGPLIALVSCLMGAMLAAGWSYLKSPGLSPATSGE